MPAAEIERVATAMIVEALTDKRWIDANIAGPDTSITDRQATVRRARELAAQLGGDDPVSRRSVVLLFVERVVLDQSSVEIGVRPSALHGSKPGATAAIEPQAARVVSLRQNVIVRRRGPETRLVIEGHGPPDPEPDAALIKGVAQAHRWWGDLVDNRYATLREIAVAYGTDERYAAWVMRLAFMGCDLTRRILDGTQPAELTLHRLLKEGTIGA